MDALALRPRQELRARMQGLSDPVSMCQLSRLSSWVPSPSGPGRNWAQGLSETVDALHAAHGQQVLANQAIFLTTVQCVTSRRSEPHPRKFSNMVCSAGNTQLRLCISTPLSLLTIWV